MSLRILLSLLFLATGTLHFLIPQTYIRIMPPCLPWHLQLVYLSGLCEILGGLGLFLAATRPFAAWGLIALLVAVFPANVQMLHDHTQFPGIPLWVLWLRLPLQVPLIGWTYRYTRR